MPQQPSARTPPPNTSLQKALDEAKHCWDIGQRNRAVEICQAILKQIPAQPAAEHLLGLIAIAEGNSDAAYRHFGAAARAPNAPAVYLSNFAEVCRRRGALAEGEAAASKSVKRDPNASGGWNNLGIIQQELGKFAESRRSLERALALAPADAAGHNNLANTLKHLGQASLAISHWRTALGIKHDYVEALSNLGLALVDQGEFAQAASCATRAIGINPRSADAYLAMAAVATARIDHADALAWLDRLLAFDPDHALGLASRALTNKQLDRLDQALADAKRSVKIAPNSQHSHNALGQVLQAMGRFDEAIAEFELAAGIPGTAREKSLHNRATLLTEFGKLKEGKQALEGILKEFPDSIGAWFNIADYRKFAAGDPDIQRMEGLVDRRENTWTDNLLLHFALGKAYLDAGASVEAFRHLDKGNAMKRASLTYDGDATARWMATIRETFTAEVLTRKIESEAPFVPVFVVGMPRSGTTLIEQILSSNDGVAGAGELRYLSRIADPVKAYPQSIPKLPDEALAAMAKAYFDKAAPLARGSRYLVDKMPANFLYVGLISMLFPTAKIIHSKRNPADTCLSCYSKLFAAEQSFTYNLKELGNFYLSYQALMAYWREAISENRMIEVNYEALVSNPEDEARRMSDFIGLPWDPACLDFHEASRAVRTASVHQVRKPIYQSSKGRWRKHGAQLQELLDVLKIDEGVAGV